MAIGHNLLIVTGWPGRTQQPIHRRIHMTIPPNNPDPQGNPFGAPPPPPATNPYPAPGASFPPPAAGGSAINSPGGFFSALFDFSFTRFITPMIIKFVYILATAAIGLAYVFMVAVTMSQNPAGGLLLLILGPVIAIIYLAFIRMTLEIYLAVVRMSEDIHQRLPRS